MSTRKFRFGVVAAQAGSGQQWQDKARRIESQRFATLVLPDTLQYTLSPFPALAAAAAATRTLRVGTYVLANDYRHPVMLAKEAATLDFLSEGRLLLAVGVGDEDERAYRACGVPKAQRGGRLDEAIPLLQRLWREPSVTHSGRYFQLVEFNGTYYTTSKASIAPAPVQVPLPILIAASQPRLLTLAAREADIVTLAIQPEEGETQVAERIERIRAAAADRFSQIDINVNLMAVGGQVPRQIQMMRGAEAARQLAESDGIAVLKGTTEQMCERLEWLRDRFGINYVVVGDELMDALAPIVERLAGK